MAVEEKSGYVGGRDVGVVVEVRMGAFVYVAFFATKVNGDE